MPSAPLTSSTQSASTLADAVVHRSTRSVDLSQQRGAVDHHVMEQLRNALHLNDFFVSLSLANNPLRDNCVAALCAILKDQNYISSLSLENCDLLDKDMTYYVVPALLSHTRMRSLDLSKNTCLTDGAADALARLIREGDLVELHLIGVPLTRKSGKTITSALAQNSSLTVCELPYTIGFEAIDEAALFLQRNIRQKEMIREQAKNREAMEAMVSLRREAEMANRVGLAMEAETDHGSVAVRTAASHQYTHGDSPLAALDGQSLGEQHQLARYYTEHGRKNAVLVAPPLRDTTSRGRSSPPTTAGVSGTKGSSRGVNRSKVCSTASHTGRAASRKQPGSRLPPNPPLRLPPLRSTQSAVTTRTLESSLLPTEVEWRSRLDPATARSMHCLDRLQQPEPRSLYKN